MSRLPYSEGTWFAVPLGYGGYAVGIVARATAKGKVILCYFFGPRRETVATISEVDSLGPSEAICVHRVGDLSLIRGEWPIIGSSPSWKRSDWPMPAFTNQDPLSGRAWRVYYSDTDPNLLIRREPVPYDPHIRRLEIDSLYGAGAAEIVLTKLLG